MKNLIVLSGMSLVITISTLQGLAATGYSSGTVSVSENTLNRTEKTGNHIERINRNKLARVKKLHRYRDRDISFQSKEAFNRDFDHKTIVSTKRSTYFDEIVFEQDHIVKTAFYDADSKLVATAEAKIFADLPVKAQTYINSKYPGYSKDAVVFVDDNEFNESDMVMYARSFEDADNYFIELIKGDSKIVLKADMNGVVDFFKNLR